MRVAIFLILFFSGCSLGKPLSDRDIILTSAGSALIIYDWTQTKKFRSMGMPETFPMLGDEPSQSKVDIYITAGILSTLFIIRISPEWLSHICR
jgi:hypothetical protein